MSNVRFVDGRVITQPVVAASATSASHASTATSASYAEFATSASYAVSSSHEIIKEVSSSHADTALSASYALTASYALNAGSNVWYDGTTFISSSLPIKVDGSITASGDIVLEEDQRVYFEADKGTYIESHASDTFRVVVNDQQMFLLDEDTGNRAVFGNGTKVFIGANNNKTPVASLHVAGDIWVSGSNGNITASGDISASGDVIGKDLYTSEYLYHTNDTDTYLRFAPDLVNLVGGGDSVLRFNKSDNKIVINNTNENYDFHIMADDGRVILHADAGDNRIGINTTTPSEALSVSGSLNVFGELGHITASGNISSSGTGSFGSINGPIDGDFDIRSDKNINLYVDNDGDGSFHKFQLWEDGSVFFAVAEDGKAAIGEAVDSNSLDGLTVVGGITATSNITGSNISASGYVSASSFIGDGSQLTGISAGFWTGSNGAITRDSDVQITGSLIVSGSFITATPSGLSNTVIGSGSAPGINTGAYGNVIIGNETATSFTNGDDNVIIGENAGQSITTGYDNVYIGHSSGLQAHSTNAIGNVAIGVDAGLGAGGVYSSRNVFVGQNAGREVDGESNVYVGREAGRGEAGADGTSNSGFGAYALTDNRDGNYNIGIGYYAGGAIKDGSNNIFIGSGSLGELSTEAQLRIGHADLITISASLATGDIIFPSTASADYFVGDGSNLTGLPAGGPFTQVGSTSTYQATDSKDLQITGSLTISGSFHSFTLDSDNVVLGSGTGLAMLDGADNNVLIGTDSATALTTGDNNIIIGYDAGTSISTHSGNIMIGKQAGGSTTGTVSDNVYIGHMAGYNGSSTAAYNVAVGWKALQGISDGAKIYNVAIGYQAGIDVSSGDGNTLVGYNAGYNVSSGLYNTLIGYQNAYTLSTGNYNTFLGMNNGESVTGDNNIIIGQKQGQSLTSGDNNIFIGSGSKGTAGAANQLQIGISPIVTISASLVTGDIIFPSTASADYFVGDGSQLTNLPSSDPFPFTGDAQITGSLVVSGSFNAFRLDTTSIILGNLAGNAIATGGTDNVMIGYQAGTAVSTGDANVFIGQDAAKVGNQSKNIALGYQAGVGYTGEQNVSIGYQAGYGAALASAEEHNTQIGGGAGRNNWRGSGNTFLGYYAGYNGYDNEGCIIIGSGSLGAGSATGGIENQLRIGNGNSLITISASLATGHVIVNSLDVSGEFIPYGVAHISSSNTAIGSGSGEDMTTGVQNVLIGELAGKDNTIGDGNVMVGFEAGETNTLGDNNVLIGYQAGKDFGTGTASDNNVAIGYKAGMGSGYTDANYNIFIGHQAGIDATSGDSNIGLGFNSLFELKGGSNNVALGYQTGVNITSGAKNVMIGYEAGFKVSTGGNNIFIGEGSNGTELGGETGTSNTLRIGIDDVVAISASLTTGDIIFPASASFLGLPTTEPEITGSIWMSGSSAAHPKSQYLMIFNP